MVFQCSQISQNGWNHSVNNNLWNLVHVYCPVCQFVNLATMQVIPFLSVVCQSGSSVCSKNTNVAAAGNKHILAVLQRTFSWERKIIIFKQNSWGCFVGMGSQGSNKIGEVKWSLINLPHKWTSPFSKNLKWFCGFHYFLLHAQDKDKWIKMLVGSVRSTYHMKV